MKSGKLSTGAQLLKEEDLFRRAPLQHDGLFSYQTLHGEKWGVRLKFQRQRKSWRGFADQATAQAFRDKLRTKRKTGRLIPEKYYLPSGSELLSTTIDYYLSLIEDEPSARKERQSGTLWKELFPCATAKSLTVGSLEKASQTLRQWWKFPAYKSTTIHQHLVWLAHVINHAISRGLTTTNPVMTYLAAPANHPPTIQLLADNHDPLF